MEERAYDLNTFANREPRERSGLQVVRGGGKNARLVRRSIALLRAVSVSALLLGLLLSLLSAKANITKLTMDIQSAQQELSEAESQYDYLSSVLSTKTNLKTVEEVAASRLGLLKVDASQVTYINLGNESVIERPESRAQQLWNRLRAELQKLAAWVYP